MMYSVLKHDGLFLISLDKLDVPISREVRDNNPIATVSIPDRRKDKESLPTLEFINVPVAYRGNGYGESLFLAVYAFILKKKIHKLKFSNYNDKFWRKMQSKYPVIDLLGAVGEIDTIGYIIT